MTVPIMSIDEYAEMKPLAYFHYLKNHCDYGHENAVVAVLMRYSRTGREFRRRVRRWHKRHRSR